MADLKQRLRKHSVIGLDTSIFIYHLEANPRYAALAQEILEHIQSGQSQGIVSTITIMELTVHPWRMNQESVARQYEVLLLNFPNLRMLDVSREVARQGARLRAKYNLRPADALQAATAMLGGATAWVSNDLQMKRLAPQLEVVILDELLNER